MNNTRSGTGAAAAGRARARAGTLAATATAAVAVLALVGCGAERPGNGASSVHGLVVHEWGTFTSLQGSDGRVMDGLHHTEELLPAFVHGRLASGDGLHKSMEALPEAVTQKLETPVIYFYGDVPRATVDVEFPGGVISEWYPAATMMAPAVGSLTRIAEGRMTWDVGLRELDAVKPPSVPATSVWAPSRNVASLGVRAEGGGAAGATREDEGFIFYRGLGRFELPLKVETIADGMLRVSNGSAEDIPAAFLLHVHAAGGAVTELGRIPAGGSVIASPTPKERDAALYAEHAGQVLRRALEATGLYADEAKAMVDTWQRSYFQSYGLRVLYVVPRAWTDRLLPMRVTPAPTELVRTLVGRVEVLTAAEELDILGRVKAAARAGQPLAPAEFGRFAEPKLRRALELMPADDPALRQFTQQLVTAANAMP
ncbi:MAG: hypothetical protein IT370_15160 [Deltaproteobacteria bacterium]|nr:hypothetical protein [Deltaproteobacteria bacterium]